MSIGLRAMLNKYGIRNDIMEALERKDTEAKEALIHEQATAMTKMMLNEVLRERKQFEQNQKADHAHDCRQDASQIGTDVTRNIKLRTGESYAADQGSR